MNSQSKQQTVIYVESKEGDIFHEVVISEFEGYVLLSSDMARIPIKLNPEECVMIANSLRYHAKNITIKDDDVCFYFTGEEETEEEEGAL